MKMVKCHQEGSIETQMFGPKRFKDILLLIVEASCQQYPSRVAVLVA